MSAPPEEVAAAAPRQRRVLRSRWWTVGGLGLISAFVAVLVWVSLSASVPVGASGPTGAMAMAGGRLTLTMRDVNGGVLRVPGRGPGVVVFAGTGCDVCRTAIRAATAAVSRFSERPRLVVVIVDASTSRGAIQALARSVGPSPARYVVDDRSNSLASTFGATGLGSIVVYDARGRIVARPTSAYPALFDALGRASR